eukprot:TRINITY_DN29217_c0_g1_i2.p1 TRINITY_DN29217_c0_g1~~TRINITY_DN29217_c0_g1_i2.p1  ORF type:complete len:951 (-),score=218.53 TRINITY_DN29217_c0_g1_i2:28-2880(-)
MYRSESPQPPPQALGIGGAGAAAATAVAAGEGGGDEFGSRIMVAVRCRPLSDRERAEGIQDICKVVGQKLVILLDPDTAKSNDYLRQDKSREKRFAFDQAFGADVGTREVFTTTTEPLISAVMQAYNASVFAYGSTGAGKTFTMIGTPQAPGVMLHTVEALFARTAEARNAAGSGSSSAVWTIRCSFIEVYNENLRDLLSTDGREGCLDLREDPNKGMCVANVTETEAESPAEVLELLRRGNQRRTTEPTAMNVTSSRSHAVLQVTVEQRETDKVLLGKLSLIDLAGSERASQTDNRGARLLEGANINRSLLALGNCINALASGCSFVPYRDSKLTRLLKDSLGGNCKTSMIANVSPASPSYEDTLNTLKYANRAKNIRVSAQQNIVKPDDHVSQYEKAINDLRGQVALLRHKLAEREAPAAAVPGGIRESRDERQASESWKAEVLKNLESRTRLQRSLIEIDRSLTQWRSELERANSAIARISETGALSPSSNHGSLSGRLSQQPQNLQEWQDKVAQVEESIRENMETRRSIERRLEQNKNAGKELQAQLPHRVLNEDLRAFLELIQRVQVMEVERLQLDHHRETQRTQLEARDQEIAVLREQLRLRNKYIRAQRDLLSAEQQEQLPSRVSLLGSTLAEASPVQQRGPLRIMQAWAPQPKEVDDVTSWDSRPLRERAEPTSTSAASGDGKDAKSTKDKDKDSARDENGSKEGGAASPDRGAANREPGADDIDWRNMELPRASQIRGVARIQPPGSGPIVQLAPKGWRHPPELRSTPQPTSPKPAQPAPPHSSDPMEGAARPPKPATGGVMHSRHAGSPGFGAPPQPQRGSTCPPLRRGSRRRPSRDEGGDPVGGGPVGGPVRRTNSRHLQGGPALDGGTPQTAGPVARPSLAAPSSGVASVSNAAGGGARRGRARSEHSGSRMNRIGRILVQPRHHDLGSIPLQSTPGR